jgi:hypothetical protein
MTAPAPDAANDGDGPVANAGVADCVPAVAATMGRFISEHAERHGMHDRDECALRVVGQHRL